MAPDLETGDHGPRLQLVSDRLVLVEGKDEVNLFNALIQRRLPELASEVQVVAAGGKEQFPANLKAIQIQAKVHSTLRSICVVRDADDSPSGAFQSVCDHLRNSGLQAPERHGSYSEGVPAVGVFIVPDGFQHGAIETLCRRSTEGSDAARCVDQYLDCLAEHGALKSNSCDKSFAHAYLAAMRNPVARVGEGARMGAWDLESEAFDKLVNFLAGPLQVS